MLQEYVGKIFKTDDFAVLIIGVEESASKLKSFKEEKGIDLTIGLDLEGDIYHKFAVKKIPRNYVISKNGKIIYQDIGYTKDKIFDIFYLVDNLIDADSAAERSN